MSRPWLALALLALAAPAEAEGLLDRPAGMHLVRRSNTFTWGGGVVTLVNRIRTLFGDWSAGSPPQVVFAVVENCRM